MIRYALFVVVLVLLTGCAGISGVIEPEPQTDAIIAAKIKERLIEQETLDAAAIHVDSDQGLVVLEGFVETEQQRDQAGQAAASVEGVRQVDNRIEVK